jgi:hypothetical protein
MTSNDGEQGVMRVLERAAEAGLSLIIDLRDGRRFADGVCEVRRLCGEDVAILHANNRVVVADIVRAEPVAQDDAELAGVGWASV